MAIAQDQRVKLEDWLFDVACGHLTNEEFVQYANDEGFFPTLPMEDTEHLPYVDVVDHATGEVHRINC